MLIDYDWFKWNLVAYIAVTYLSKKNNWKQLGGKKVFFSVLHLVGYFSVMSHFRF